jgi:prepilin peptidase CpaA
MRIGRWSPSTVRFSPVLLAEMASERFMAAPNFIVTVPLLAILAVATFSDLRERRIPNALSLGGAALGLLTNVANFGSTGAALALGGWVLCLACFLPLYMTGGTAAGDVKLMAMVGAFLGPMNGFFACAFALLAGASLATLYAAWRGIVAPRLRNSHAGTAHALDKIPYATAIAIGAVAAVLQPAWVTASFN